MNYIIFIFLFFSILFFLTKISKKLNLIDHPNKRKIHLESTPTVGGLAIILSLFIFSFFIPIIYEIRLLFYVSLIIFMIGMLDDIFQVNILIRFFFQFFSASILIGSGLTIVNLGGYSAISSFELGIFGVFLTFFSVLCLINAINFIDGLNGLSSGSIIISLFSLILFTYFEGNNINDIFIYFLILACICFFLVNIGKLPFKIVFLGDSGSTSLGFILSFLLIYYTLPDNRLMHPVLSIWCIAFPMFELLNVIIKRLRLKINIFHPDKRHIHHILLNKNFTHNQVLCILLSLSVFLNFFGFIIYLLIGPGPSLLSFVLVFLIYYYFSSLLNNNKFN